MAHIQKHSGNVTHTRAEKHTKQYSKIAMKIFKQLFPFCLYLFFTGGEQKEIGKYILAK